MSRSRSTMSSRPARSRRIRRRCSTTCSVCWSASAPPPKTDRLWQIAGDNDLPEIAEVWRLLLAETAGTGRRTRADRGRRRGAAAASSPTARARPTPRRCRWSSICCMARRSAPPGSIWFATRSARSPRAGRRAGRCGCSKSAPTAAPPAALLDRLAQSRRRVPLYGNSSGRRAGRPARLCRCPPSPGPAPAAGRRTSRRRSRRRPVRRDPLGACLRPAAARQPPRCRGCAICSPRAGCSSPSSPHPTRCGISVFGRYAGWWQAPSGAAVSPLRSGRRLAQRSRDRRVRRSRCGAAGDRAVAEFGVLGPGADRPQRTPWRSAGRRPRSSDLIADRRPIAERGFARAAWSAPGTGSASSMRPRLPRRPARRRRRPDDRGARRESRSSSSAEDGDDAAEQAAQLIALLPQVAAAAAQRPDPALAGHQRRPAISRWRGRPGLVGAALWGFAPGADQRDPAAVAAPRRSRRRRWTGPSAAAAIASELAAASAGNRDRLDHVGAPRPAAAPRSAAALGGAGRRAGADRGTAGRPRRAGLAAGRAAPAGPGEVAIDVHAAGLNFRDMMWAMGLLPEEALIDGFAGPTFGLECAGIVRAVGAGVDGSGGRRPGGRLRPRRAEHPGDHRGACRHPDPARHELCGGGDDPGDLCHRDLRARHAGKARSRANSC